MSLSQSNAAAVQSTGNNERQVSTLSTQSNPCTPRPSDAAQSNTNESMINRGAKGRSTSASLPTRMPAPSYQTNQAAAASASGLGCAPARQSQIGALSAPLPPEPVSISTLQTWSREQLGKLLWSGLSFLSFRDRSYSTYLTDYRSIRVSREETQRVQPANPKCCDNCTSRHETKGREETRQTHC